LGFRKLAVVLSVLVLMSLPVLVFLTPSISSEPSQVISVRSNADLAELAASRNWNGTGTPSDPYVLENLTIDAGGSPNCIYFADTTLSFVIKWANLTGASGAAIEFYNVINGRVEGSSIHDNVDGISLVASFDNSIDGVNSSGNGRYGLSMDHSGGNFISSSTFGGNQVGIRMWSSSENELTSVNCTGSIENGMYLSASSYNTLDQVNCSWNGQSGIYMTSSRWNEMTGSILSNNTIGIWMDYSSDNNTIEASTVHDNSYVGANLTHSNGNIIRANTFVGEPYATNITNSWDDTFTANIMTGCSMLLQGDLGTFTSQQITADNLVNGRSVIYNKSVDLGTNNVDVSAGEVILGGVTGGVVDGIDFADLSVAICIGHSSGVTVNDCTVSNAKMAVYLQDSTSCIIGWSEIEDSAVGLYLTDGQGNKVDNNTVSRTAQGLMVVGSTANLIADNTCSNCSQGVVLDSADNNRLLRNRLDNDTVGINLVSSDMNEIKDHNRFVECSTGALIVGSWNNTVSGNEGHDCDKGIKLVESTEDKIVANTLTDNGAGISVQGGQKSTVSGNDCYGNTVGIEVNGSVEVLVEDNDCNNNDNGIWINGTTTSKAIENDCIGNTGNGIMVQGSREIVLDDNTCTEDQIGILLLEMENFTVVGNTCNDNNIGIHLTGSTLGNITDNICNGCSAIGIGIDGSNENEVTGNECSNDQDGIRLFYSNDNLIEENDCSDDYAGIYLLWSDGNEIVNNSCFVDNRYGIGLDSSSNNRAVGNNCSFNFNYGIGLYLADGNTFINNTLMENAGHGLYIESGSGNQISNNAFVGNNKAGSDYTSEHAQAYDAGTGNIWNTHGPMNNYGNYWSDLTSPDADEDSVVDQVYKIVGPARANDALPLISPYLTYPGAPVVTLAVAHDGSAVIFWTAPGTLGGAKITNYTIYRSTGQGTFVLIATVGKVLTYTDTGLDNGQPYSYKVSAVNLMGEGALSEPEEVTPAREPDAPVDLIINLNGTTSVDLSWTAPYNGGANITEYRIYRGPDNSSMVLLATVTDGLNYTDNATWYGLKYFYWVTAVNVMGEGNASNEVNITMPTVPPFAPQNLTSEGLDDQIDLTWEPPLVDGGSNVTGYVIYRGTDPMGQVQYATVGNVTAFVDTDVVHGTVYYYTVAAINTNGPGSTSNVASNVSLTVPGAPKILSALIQNNYIVLTWIAPDSDGGSSITWYAIYRSTSPGEEVFLTNVTADTLTYVDTTFETGVPQYYRICAINDQGTGPISNEVTAKNTKTLVGTVTDQNGNPIAGATVTIDSRTYTTDQNGQYVAEVIPGKKTITISASGYQDISVEKDVTIRTYDLGTIQLSPLNAGGVLSDLLLPLLVIVAAVSAVVILVIFRTMRRNRDRKARGKR
jgi:parallel beta-helix repeat protein